MECLHCCVLVLYQTVIFLLYLWLQTHLVVRCTATLLFYVGAEPQCLGTAAWICSLVASVGKFGFECVGLGGFELFSLAGSRVEMLTALGKFTAYESILTDLALEADESCPDLPVDVLPLDTLLVVHELDESVQIKESVSHMLCNYLTVKVNEDLSIRAHHPLVLVIRE